MIETVRTFTALSEEFVELSMQHDPVAATGAGIHDYDATLPDDSPEGLAARAAWLRDLDQRLVASVPWDELPAATRVDFALLRSRIASQRADLEEIHVPQRTPALFLRRAFLGVHIEFGVLQRAENGGGSRMAGGREALDAATDRIEAGSAQRGQCLGRIGGVACRCRAQKHEAQKD
mgnify:CR=1 FL=1